MTNTNTTEHRDLEIFRSGRSIVLDELAREQAILNDANETDMSEELAAEVNAASFRNRGERNLFKNAFRRHTRNIGEGNPFYQ